MSAHTPGPWDGKRVDLWGSDRVGLGLGFLSTSNEERRAEGLANARLIAAAPELYDAAENALNVIIACCKPDDGVDDAKAIADARTMLRAALAKANGK